MLIFIDGTDVTQYVVRNSITTQTALQERASYLRFGYFGAQPDEYDEVRAFSAYRIRGATSTTVTLNIDCNLNDLFRVGAYFWKDIGTVDEEKKEITSIDVVSGYLVITTSTWDATPTVGRWAGKREFAGNVLDVTNRNIVTLQNQEQQITCVSYTKIFDKQLVNDTYEDVDGRYIVNDFCNNTININQAIDDMDYTSDGSVQAEWTESGDGGNPTRNTTDLREGISSVNFPYTYSGGTATFTASPSVDISDYTGVATGTPTKGVLGFWLKSTGGATSVSLKIGSDNSNYGQTSITPTTDWVFYDVALPLLSITGTPDWENLDYFVIEVTETTNGSIRVDGVRVLETQFFRHYPYVQETPVFENFRINRVKPTEVLQRMVDEIQWFWKVDDDRYIHVFPQNTTQAPFSITETSDNFKDLNITWDITRLVNRQVVQGGEETSDEFYSESREGNGSQREWLTKNKFVNLQVYVDDGSVTDTMEALTTTTTVKATAHGLSIGDWIVNRTQGANRKVLTVPDADTFTVEAVSGQASGDTFSKGVLQTVGVEGLNDDIGNDFMSNFNEKSIRNAEGTATLEAGTFIWFKYREVFPILVQRQDLASIGAMKTKLGYTNGVFDGQPSIDRTIKTRSEANNFARAILNKYANLIITAKFSTYINGLECGQEILVQDQSGTRNINQYFMILQISRRQIEWNVYVYDVQCSSLLYGMLELLQQLLRRDRKIAIDEDQIINNVEDQYEGIVVESEVDILVHPNQWTYGLDPDQARYELSNYS